VLSEHNFKLGEKSLDNNEVEGVEEKTSNCSAVNSVEESSCVSLVKNIQFMT